MQNRRGDKYHGGAINEDYLLSNGGKYQSTNTSDSSDEYEEDTHIRYHFRRWANHIWSVSNNVTSRLRGLLSNRVSSNTTSNQSEEESDCEDESNDVSWTVSTGIIESSNRNNNADCNTRNYHHVQNHHRSTPSENYYKYGQKFSHVTEGHRLRHVMRNSLEMPPNFMSHGATTYHPVLILPRIHQGANRHSMDPGAYQSRKHMLRYRHMRGAECVDGWYRHYHHLGKHWGCEGFGSGGNDSTLLNPHQIPENLGPSRNDRKVEGSRRKPTWTCRVKRKSEANGYRFGSVKHFSTQISDFHSESYGHGHKSVTPVYHTRHSREESSSKILIPRYYGDNGRPQDSNDSSRPTSHTRPKNVLWNSQLSDINSQKLPGSTSQLRVDLSAKSSITLHVEQSEIIVDRNLKSTDLPEENLNALVTDDTKNHETTVTPVDDTKALEQQQNSDDISIDRNSSEKQKDDLEDSKSVKWSSVTKNGVDSLLQSLRERMDTLANVHSLDTEAASNWVDSNRKEESSLKKECIVASCLAGNYLSQCSEKGNKIATHPEARNEETRPSFSDRIQDIWRDGRTRVWGSSPMNQTSSSRYNLKSEKELPSKLSLLGLNQQPVLREYFGEQNNAVTLTRILENLIDSKSKSDVTPSPVSQAPKPPPRISRKQSKTCIRVNVGIQKSTPTSTPSSQDRTFRPRRRLLEKQRSRRGFCRNFKPHVPQLPIEAPRPLQVFSGQSIIPISSIRFTPVIQPLSNFSGISQPPLDPRSSFDRHENLSGRRGHSTIIDNPVFQEANAIPFVDSGLNCPPFLSNSDSPAPTRGSSFTVEEEYLTLHGIKNLNEAEMDRQVISEQERILSLVLEKIEHKRRRAERIAQNTDLSLQHGLDHHSGPIQPQESRVAEDGAGPATRTMSTRGCSWWKKRFYFNKRSTLKVKIASIFKNVTKKRTDEVRTPVENVVPIPPVRMKRKSNAVSTKSNKSIQWEVARDLSSSVEKIDSFQVTENEQSHKSTSVGPVAIKVLVTSGTNTNLKKSKKKTRKVCLKQNRGTLVDPAINQVSEHTCTDFSNKLLASDGTSIDTDIVANAREKSESLSIDDRPGIDNSSSPVKEICDSSTDTCQLGERNSMRSIKSRISRSSSSKIPLAIKPTSPSNASSIISSKRPSTAPILENWSSDSSRSTAFLGESDVDKSFGSDFANRETANRETAKKALFKHNRSSLLRANNSMSRKCAKGQVNLSRKSTGEKYIERTSTPKALTSSVEIDKEKSPIESYSVPETRCNDLDSEKPSKDNVGEMEMKILPSKLAINDFLETHSAASERKIISGAPSLKTKELTHNEEIFNLPTSSLGLQLIEQKPSLGTEASNLCENGRSICCNLEHEDKPCSPRGSTSPLKVEPNSSQADEAEELPNLNGESTEKSSRSSILNVSELQSDRTCFLVEKSAELETDKMKTTTNEETKFQPELAYSTPTNVSHKLVLRNREINTQERSRRPCSQSKSIPSSTLSPQHSIGKSSVKGARLLCKNLELPSLIVARSNLVNDRRNADISEATGLADDSQDPTVSMCEFQLQDAAPAGKTVKAVSQVAKTTKYSEQKLPKTDKMRNQNTKDVLEMVLKVIDTVIDESMIGNRKTNLGMTSLERNSSQGIISNSEEPLELSIDSFEPIRLRTPSGRLLSLEKKFGPVVVDAVGVSYLPPCLLDQEMKVENSCSQIEQPQLSPSKKPKIRSDVIIDQRRDDHQGVQSSKKFLVTGKPRKVNHTSALSDAKREKVSKDRSEFVVQKSQISCYRSDKVTRRNSRFELIEVSLKMGTEEDRKKETPLETKYHSPESTIILDLAETGNEQVEARPSLLGFKLEGNTGKKKTENRKLFDADSNSRVMNVGNSGKSSRRSRNVKIDNKLLEQKVKCSIENGVPLKTITITDPSMIKSDCSNHDGSMAVRIMHKQDLRKMKAPVQDKLSKKLSKNPEDPIPDLQTEEQSSHSTWATSKNQGANIEDKTIPETSSSPKSTEFRTVEDSGKIVNKKPTRRKGTLIPRYKKLSSSS